MKVKEEDPIKTLGTDFVIHKERIQKILDDALRKLRLITHLPILLGNNGEILRQYLSKTEADFVVMVCEENSAFISEQLEERSDLMLICNMLERIDFHEKRGSQVKKLPEDNYNIHITYAMEIIFRCQALVAHLETLDEPADSIMTSFVHAMQHLKEVLMERLKTTAQEEIKRENELKSAYRSSLMLSDNIQQLEEILEKQRTELSKERDRKEIILQDLKDKIEELQVKSRGEINKIVYDSEMAMMKKYNVSAEKQEELSVEATKATTQFENLLQDHLTEEKTLRAKRLKVEAQLANWIAKYDTDIGEKQAEYDELERIFNEEKDEFEVLQEQFEEQQVEYLALMKEKEEEERRIYEEQAWIFLQNRAARRIQRGWRAYKAKKLARKKARKSKKKGGSAGSKKKSGSAGSKKGKKEDALKHDQDPNALLEGKFDDKILGSIENDASVFEKQSVVVDLTKD